MISDKAIVLMDESRFNRRFVRRLALMAAIQCATVTAIVPYSMYSCFADDLPRATSNDDGSMRSLLSNGWDKSIRADESSNDIAAEAKQWTKLNRAAPKKTHSTPMQTQLPKRQQLIESKLTRMSEHAPNLVPLQIQAVEAVQIQPQKQLALLPPTMASQRVAKERARQLDRNAKTDLATPILPSPKSTRTSLSEEWIQEQQKSALSRVARDQGFALVSPSGTSFAKTNSGHLKANPIAHSVASPKRELNARSPYQMPPFKANAAEANSAKSRPVESHAVESKAITSNPALPDPVYRPSPLSTVHAAKLQEVAIDNLREASDRLHRGATFSAKRLTIKALNNIVQMRDLEDGGNEHAKQFEAAMTAIRESKDFRNELGAVNQRAIKRLVAIHSTDVLKKRDLSPVTTLHALECYLLVAQQKLIQSTQGVPVASQALTLLGQIERTMADVSDTHASATALTFQNAAVAIEPANVMAQFNLGQDLYAQKLYEQAFDAFSVCVQKRPNRRSYQMLMKTAQRLGDQKTARDCMVALRNPQLPSTTPVRRLKAADFASTYQPDNRVARNSPAEIAKATEQLDAKPVSGKTKIGSKLKGWISDKFR